MMNNNLIVSDRFPSEKEINKRIKQSKKNNTNTKPDISKIVDLADYLGNNDKIGINIIQKETLRLVDEIVDLGVNEYLQETGKNFEDDDAISEEIDLLILEMINRAEAINSTFKYLNDDEEEGYYDYSGNYILEAIENLLMPYTDRVKLILKQN